MSDIESESEYEESPPWFKYKRVNGLPSRLFTSDPVSASCIILTTIIFGTHSGMIVILNSQFEVLRMFKAHAASVLSIDSDGVHFATASMDGTLNIGNLSNNDIVKYDFKRPLHAVALHKPYSKTKGFFSGGTAGDVIYSTKNWLGQRQDTVLTSGGCVTLIKEQEGLLLWCNDLGITIAQINTRKELMHLPVPTGIGRPELYWPRVKMDKFHILIGWLDTVWNLKVEGGNTENGERVGGGSSSVLSGAASSLLYFEEKSVEIICREKLSDCLIAGLVEYNEDLVVLNYLPKVGSRSFPPELKVLDGVSFDEVSIEELVLNGYEGLGMNDFDLIPDSNVQRWFLISSNDAIIVEPYTLKDKIDWLVENERYLEAWNLSGHVFSIEERLAIGESQMKQWYEKTKVDKCVHFLPKWLGNANAEFWNKWVRKLGCMNCIDVLPFQYIGIDHEIYDETLTDLVVGKEFEKLNRYANLWDHQVYDLKSLQSQLGEELNDDTRKLYIQLSLELDEPEVCVPQLIIMKDCKLMEFLDEHHLLVKFIDHLAEIIMIGVEDPMNDALMKTNIQILIENINELNPAKVLETFRTIEVVNYLYLKELRRIDPELVKDFEDDIVKLYANFNVLELGNFLRKHRKYSIDEAILVCEDFGCKEELVYLLSKIGENKKALNIIIDDLNNPKMAVTFVQKINEKDLWDYLLDYSMTKSEFIRELLMNVGELVDPIPVVSRIPKGVEIDGLKGIISTITRNTELELKVYGFVMHILGDEYMKLADKMKDMKSKGYVVTEVDLTNMKDYEETYIRFQGKISKEVDLIGFKWDGDVGNKMLHKSFIQYKLREKIRDGKGKIM